MRRELSILLLILLVLVLIYLGRFVARTGSTKSGFILERIDPVQIHSISIIQKKDTVNLIKKDGNWVMRLDSVRTARINTEMIERLQRQLREMTYDLVSHNPENFDKLQVTDEKGLKVYFLGNTGDTLAGILIGKTGPDFASTYVRNYKEKKVFLASTNLRSVFPVSKLSWRDRKMISFNLKDFQKIAIYTETDSLVANRDSVWQVYDIEKPDTNKIKSAVRLLTRLTAIDFEDKKQPAEVGLEPPKIRVHVELIDGTEHVLLIGDEYENRGYYAMVKGDNQIYVISKYTGDQLSGLKEKLLESKEKSKGSKKK